nr:hypothetical protein [Tanacetum cinerariifolium]
PPHMDKQPSGRQKSMKRIRSKDQNQLQSDVEGAGHVVIIDKGVGKPFQTQKGSSQQADDYLQQSMSWSFDDVNLDDP